ncbi:MAG: hypothetical protein ABL971_10995 [Vicinamibacterales bacterium]
MGPRQRSSLGDTLREFANLEAAALVLGQFIGDRSLSVELLVAGIAIWVLFVGLALALEGGA